jgi:hypothetical protein
MRRGLALLIVPAFLVFGCSGDDDDGASGDETIVDQLGDDPTLEECLAAVQQVLESIEVPDGVDPSDGLDAEEQPKADAAVEKAFSDGGLDPDGDDDRCAEHAGDEADDALTAMVADLDPDVQAMLGVSG